jgi:midasin
VEVRPLFRSELIYSVIYTFITVSPFRHSPLSLLTGQSNLSTERIHSILLAYLRLLTADPNIATRLEWSATPLLQLRAHADTGVKLLCILVIAKQQGLSEEKRMVLEREWIGDVKGTDARVFYGKEITLVDGGCEFRDKWIDGWLLPVFEARRETECKLI